MADVLQPIIDRFGGPISDEGMQQLSQLRAWVNALPETQRGLVMDHLKQSMQDIQPSDPFTVVIPRLQQEAQSYTQTLHPVGDTSGQWATTLAQSAQGMVTSSVAGMADPASQAPGPGPQDQAPQISPTTNLPTGTQLPLTRADIQTQQYGPDTTEQYLSGILGMTPQQLQQQYQKETEATGVANRSLARTTGEAPQAVPYAQWLQQQYKTAQGQDYWFLQVWSQRYTQQFGTAMPTGLMQSLKQKLDALPYADRSDLIAQFAPAALDAKVAGSSALGPNQSSIAPGASSTQAYGNTDVPWVDQAFRDWQTNNPTADQEAQRDQNNVRNMIESKIKGIADQATVDKITALPGVQRVQAINDLTMPGTHLTVGQYDATTASLSGPWHKYFNTDPQLSDVEWAAKYKDAASLEDAIRLKPSHMQDLNIGEYTTLHTASDQLRTKLWQIPSDNAFMQLVGSVVQK